VHSLAEAENSEVKVVSQSWLKSLSQPARSALVVLCKRPSNNRFNRTRRRRALVMCGWCNRIGLAVRSTRRAG
jgi:hypothetical protein